MKHLFAGIAAVAALGVALGAGYAYYKKAKMLQKVIRKEFEDALKLCDAIITPLNPTTAFKIGENCYEFTLVQKRKPKS